MDKQVQYIKIIKANEFKWYADKVGQILPVYDNPAYPSQWMFYKTAFGIERCDCEPYVFPTTIQEQDVEQLAQEYAKKEYPIASRRELDLAAKDFKAGYAANTGAVPEKDLQLIHEQKLKDLHYWIGHSGCARSEIQGILSKWFPTVFKPERTYRIGQQFERDNVRTGENEGYILGSVNVNQVLLICLQDGQRYGEATTVKNPEKITEHEFSLIAGYEPDEFRLIN